MKSQRIQAALLMGVFLLQGCAPQRMSAPATGEAPGREGKPAPQPRKQLYQEVEELCQRAEAADLPDSESQALLAAMDDLMRRYLASSPEVQADPQLQGALERMFDIALQMSLDGNSAPEEADEAAPAPSLEEILKQTTFLSHDELKKVYDEVGKALAARPMDIPIEVNDSVLSYINAYQTRLRDWFSRALTRGAPYMGGMKEIFRREGVPESIVYLSIVESACNVKAYSRANAAGMWQFIAGTARRYDLKVDFWVDERFDPWKSALASARYLKDLYGIFGDWHLALAAYNCGEGRIQRNLQKAKEADFWDMRKGGKLVRETREYVPAILASILIASNPAAYGFEVPSEEPPEPAAEVRLEEATDLRVLARCAGVSVEEMRALNPSLRRMMTPPRPFTLRIPQDSLAGFEAALKSVPAEERLAIRMHRVKRGESLKSIARKYGVNGEAIRLANLMSSRKVRAGQELIIPLGAAAAAPELYVEARPKRKPPGRVYRVKRGDTLSSISLRTGVPLDTLRSLNRIHGSQIRPGQRLVLGASERGTKAPKGKAWGKKRIHHVQKGDTLYIVAKRYGTSVDKLCRANRITRGKRLHPGDSLIIP